MKSSNVSILGIADSTFGKLPQHSYLSLSALLIDAAIKDAGIEWGELDGLLVSSSQAHYYNRPALAVAEYVGVQQQLKFVGGPEVGGASPFLAVMSAVGLLEAGICRYVAIVSCDVPRTGQDRKASVRQFALMRDPVYEQPYGLTNAGSYALLASAYQERYGISDRERASVAVAHRKFAVTNSAAVYRESLTVESVLESRLIANPLHLLECRPIVDGGSAIILGRSSPRDSISNTVITGYGFGSDYDQVNQIQDLGHAAGARLAGLRAYTMAGITTEKIKRAIDFACLYDSYTITAILEMEALFLCDEGSATKIYMSGGTMLDSELPINPHGGVLSQGGPSISLITEGVRQLRGDAVNQVKHATRGVINAEGGILSANAVLILER